MKSPFEILVVACENAKHDKLKNILKKFDIENDFVIASKGTAETAIGDVFGFGILDRELACCIIDSDKSAEIVEEIYNELCEIDKKHIVFSMPIDAMSSDLFSILLKEKKNGKAD